MRRPGILLRSPASPWRAFWTAFIAIAIAVGVPLTVKTLFLGNWSQWLGLLPFLLAIVFGGAALWGVTSAVPIMIQGWAWRKLAEDTPVAEHDEGLGS